MMLLALPVIFAIIHSPDGDYAAEYEGQSIGTVQRMLGDRGESAEFVSRRDYQQFLDAHKPISETPERKALKSQARKIAGDKGKSVQDRVNAISTLLDLDL